MVDAVPLPLSAWIVLLSGAEPRLDPVWRILSPVLLVAAGLATATWFAQFRDAEIKTRRRSLYCYAAFVVVWTAIVGGLYVAWLQPRGGFFTWRDEVPSREMPSPTPDPGTGTPGPVEILLLPALGIVLAGAITGLLAAVSVQLVRPWTGEGLRPPERGYAPLKRLRVPVSGSVLGTVAVFALEIPSAWVGLDGSTTGALLRVVAVGVLLGMALHWVYFGDTAAPQRRASWYSYGVFAAVWTVSTAIYYVVV